MEIIVHSKSNCPYCYRVKTLLNELGKPFTEILHDDDSERRNFYKTCGDGVKSVPQVFIDGVRIGGYLDVLKDIEKITGKTKMEDISVTYKPLRYPWAYELFKQQRAIVWTEDEVPMGEDASDWKSGKMSIGEKNFVSNILKLFTMSDVQVASNYYNYLIPKFNNTEIRMMLGQFAAMEATHISSYSILNETLGFPDSDWYAFLEYEEMKNKAEFMVDSDVHSKKGIALALAKNIMAEGVMLFASFAMLLNFRRYGKMKAMSNIVEFSIRDESIHCDGISQMFLTYLEENPKVLTDDLKKSIYEMATKTVELEDAFIDMTYSFYEPEGLSKEEIKAYVRYITNQRLHSIGMKSIFEEEKNPLPWIDQMVFGDVHSLFFESKITEYSIGSLTGEWDYNILE